jgi:hypothetical protein
MKNISKVILFANSITCITFARAMTKKYNKILSKPISNFLADESTNGSARNFISNHTKIANERVNAINKSEFDNLNVINENLRAINEYSLMCNLPILKKIVNAFADLERYIIMNTAKGKANIKIDVASNNINNVKREWLVARIAFPTDEPKNQFIRIKIGNLDKKTRKFIDPTTNKLHSLKDPIIQIRATEIIKAEIEKRMNEKGTLDELIANLNECLNEPSSLNNFKFLN